MNSMPNLVATRPRGTAIVVSLVGVLIIAAVTAALLGQTKIGSRAAIHEQVELTAFQAAEGALDRAIADLTVGGSGVFGTEDAPIPIAGGRGGRWSRRSRPTGEGWRRGTASGPARRRRCTPVRRRARPPARGRQRGRCRPGPDPSRRRTTRLLARFGRRRFDRVRSRKVGRAWEVWGIRSGGLRSRRPGCQASGRALLSSGPR